MDCIAYLMAFPDYHIHDHRKVSNGTDGDTSHILDGAENQYDSDRLSVGIEHQAGMFHFATSSRRMGYAVIP